MGRENLISAHEISWGVSGKEILQPLDLELSSGECLAIVGPNGAGKTTLLRLIAGLLEPVTGGLWFRQERYARLSRRALARRMAYVPQIRSANIPLTVERMVMLGRFPYLSTWQMTPAAADLERVEDALATVGLKPLRRRLMAELSGGERQSVFIAAALAQEAEVLLLDEPTTHLDARHQLEVAELLLGLRRSEGHSIVLATHDLNLVARLADRVLALKVGRVVASGPPESVLVAGRLEEIFDAPFEVIHSGGRAHILLQMDR